MSKVQKNTQERVKRFQFSYDGFRTLIGELLVRYYFTTTIGLQNSDITIQKSVRGKPYIEGVQEYFNITHSGEWVLVALSSHPVGVDLEKVGKADMKVAERFFSTHEFVSLQRHCRETLNESFFRLWTLKESFIKAIGEGMYCDLSSFSVHEGANNRFYVGEEQEYCLRSSKFFENYYLSFCSKEVFELINYKNIPLDAFLSL